MEKMKKKAIRWRSFSFAKSPMGTEDKMKTWHQSFHLFKAMAQSFLGIVDTTTTETA